MRLAALALPLNFAWDLLQAPAFGRMGDTWSAGLLVCARAALGDGVLFIALLGLGALAFGRRWFTPLRLGRYAVVVAGAIAIQIAIERAGLASGRWQYQPWHPRVLGAGVLPILQAVVLVPLSFALLALWETKRNRRVHDSRER